MNVTQLLGWILIASSFYFLWVYVLMAAVFLYNILTLTGQTGIDIAGDPSASLIYSPLIYGQILPGMALLIAGIYVLKKHASGRWNI